LTVCPHPQSHKPTPPGVLLASTASSAPELLPRLIQSPPQAHRRSYSLKSLFSHTSNNHRAGGSFHVFVPEGDTPRYIRSNTCIGMPWSTCACSTRSHANSGDTSTVVLGLQIEQLRMVPGNGIQETYAERRQPVNEVMAASRNCLCLSHP